MNRTAAVIMHSPHGDSYAERLVHAGREGALRDLVDTLVQAKVDDIFIVTPEEIVVPPARVLRPTHTPFHFGKELNQVISQFQINRLLYFGSGSGALLTPAHLKTMIAFTTHPQPSALLNNFYSCDFAAISQAEKLTHLDLPAIDNQLGFALIAAGFRCFALPRELVTQFDIDTPTDLILLSAAGQGGPRLRAALAGFDLNHPSLSKFSTLLTARSAHVYLIGRVNPRVWAEFEASVACRTSTISEGRGMRAYPTTGGTVLAGLLAREGAKAFIDRLAAVCDGAIIDTRPLLSQVGLLPPAADRFASDLLRPELIADPHWAEFTRAVTSAKLPIILGGHSLLSGGLYLLSAIAWKGRELPRRLHPEPLNWEKE